MESDTNSNTTVYITISQFHNSETTDEFTNSQPSPSTISQSPFQPIHSQVKIELPSPPSPISNVLLIYSLLTSEPSDNNDLENTQISHELDNFITLQQQLQHTQTLTIHQLSKSIISSKSSTPSSNTTRAYRTLKRKIPNTPFTSNPGTFVNHPLHTDTKEFLQICLTLFPQYTYFHSDPNEERPNYVNEHVLHPTISWKSFYHFTNPLTLPLSNNPHDNEVCSTQLYLLTTALTPKQFTQIGYRQSLIKFTAHKLMNILSIITFITSYDQTETSF